MDTITGILVSFAGLAGSVWSFTEFAPRVVPARNPLKRFSRSTIAAVAGPVFGVAAWGLGWVVLPGGYLAGLLGSAFAGLLATAIAGAAHDKVINPLMKK